MESGCAITAECQESLVITALLRGRPGGAYGRNSHVYTVFARISWKLKLGDLILFAFPFSGALGAKPVLRFGFPKLVLHLYYPTQSNILNNPAISHDL